MALTRKRRGLDRGRIRRTVNMSGGGGGRPGGHYVKKVASSGWRKPTKDEYEKSVKDFEKRLKETQDRIVDLLLDEEFEKPEMELAPIL